MIFFERMGLALALAVNVFVYGCVAPGAASSGREVAPPRLGTDDWPWWRGPSGDGKAVGTAPLRWSKDENVLWKSEVTGRGHASPIVVGPRVIVASADDSGQEQLVLAFDRASGKPLWSTVVHEHGFEHRHEKNSQASATPACDGERIFAVFLNRAAIWLSALDLDGHILWQRDTGRFETMHGYSSSPLIWRSFVIVTADSSAGSYLAAYHRQSGELAWKTERRAVHSFATPSVGMVAGRPQLVLNGAEQVASYDPDSGALLWSCEGPTKIMACTLALGPETVFASGGYPEKEILCLRGDGRGDVTQTHVAWRSRRGVTYVPSPVYHDGRFYAVNDGGVVSCFNAISGQEIFQGRLEGNFSASPILAEGRFYVTNEAGVTHVLRAGDRFELLASNDLGDGGFATLAICGGVAYVRTSHFLYAIGAPADAPLSAN